MEILIVDDDQAIANLLAIYIKNEGYIPVAVNDRRSALQKLRRDSHLALMVLDLMLPGMSGIQVLKKVRAHSQLPVIILSAKATDMDKINGLIGGADDYITKPFNPIEVMARIKSVLRRSNVQTSATDGVIDLGALTINRQSHEVKTITGCKIYLTALEFKILYLLASHPNRVFSAEEIFDRVWRDRVNSSSTETVMVHMSHLRDKIIRATHDNKIVQTVWGVGYKVVS